MPRSIQIAVSADRADAILRSLESIDGVVGVARQRGASIDPPGDVLAVQTTNDALRSVFSALRQLDIQSQGTILTSDLKCLISSSHQENIDDESNETVWDEMASLLRQDTNMNFNYLALMFLAGAIAAVGLWADKLHLVIGAMLIAPAFEPLVRIPFGLVAGRRHLSKHGALSTIIGYLSLVIGAAIAVLILRVVDAGSGTELETRSWVNYWSSFTPTGVFVSALGATAGAVVVSGLRSVLTTGVMIALALIPSMSIVGMAIATADLSLAGRGLARWAVDAALVLVMSLVVLGLKRRFVHRQHAIG